MQSHKLVYITSEFTIHKAIGNQRRIPSELWRAGSKKKLFVSSCVFVSILLLLHQLLVLQISQTHPSSSDDPRLNRRSVCYAKKFQSSRRRPSRASSTSIFHPHLYLHNHGSAYVANSYYVPFQSRRPVSITYRSCAKSTKVCSGIS
jgi:hypothetical protein